MPWVAPVITAAASLAGSAMNYKLQKEQQNYERDMFQTQMQREDNAYQRTVSDMRQAGLNPLSMSQINQSSAAPQSVAPSFDVNSVMNSTSQAISNLQNIQRIQNETKIADSQVAYNQALANKTNIESQYTGDILARQLAKYLQDFKKGELDYDKSFFSWNIDKQYYGDNAKVQNKLNNAILDQQILQNILSNQDVSFNNIFGLSNNMTSRQREQALRYNFKPIHAEQDSSGNWSFSRGENHYLRSNLFDMGLDVAKQSLGKLINNTIDFLIPRFKSGKLPKQEFNFDDLPF